MILHDVNGSLVKDSFNNQTYNKETECNEKCIKQFSIHFPTKITNFAYHLLQEKLVRCLKIRLIS